MWLWLLYAATAITSAACIVTLFVKNRKQPAISPKKDPLLVEAEQEVECFLNGKPSETHPWIYGSVYGSSNVYIGYLAGSGSETGMSYCEKQPKGVNMILVDSPGSIQANGGVTLP